MTSKPILKYVGLGLLILGTVLNVLMFIEQAWPTYLFFIMMAVGLALFLISFALKSLNIWWQTFICLIPFIVAYVWFDISSASNDIFLIPKGFTGLVQVYYDKPTGQSKTYEGKWRVYKVPKTGYLETQFKLKGDYIDFSRSRYFYIDKNNERQEIKPFCDYCNNKDTVTIQVIYGVVGTDSNGTFQTFTVDRPTKNYSYK